MKFPLSILASICLSSATLLAQTNSFPLTGNVGIGTTTPSYALEVEGTFKGGGRSRVELDRTAFGGIGDTVAVGSFSSDAVGKNIRIYLKGHNGGVIDVHTYEINEVAYIGPATGWLEIPVNQNSVSHSGSAAYAVDVYRPNINSPHDPLFLRVRVKRPVGTGNVQLVLEYDDDVSFTALSNNNTVSTQFNSTSSPAGGPVDGYYGALEWMFPVSNGHGWANANYQGLFIKNTGNVGIGIATPTAKFHVKHDGDVSAVLESTGNNSYLQLKNAAGSNSISSSGGTLYVGESGWIFFRTGDWGVKMAIAPNGNVGIGNTNPSHKLAVNGTIKTKEVIVETTGWSDYVLAEDYPLAPLAEVEAHIKEHKHLPGIPSAAQVSEQGVSVGDMQAKLLAKIEELTLHQIAQEKRLAEQQTRITALENENRRLNAGTVFR